MSTEEPSSDTPPLSNGVEFSPSNTPAKRVRRPVRRGSPSLPPSPPSKVVRKPAVTGARGQAPAGGAAPSTAALAGEADEGVEAGSPHDSSDDLDGMYGDGNGEVVSDEDDDSKGTGKAASGKRKRKDAGTGGGRWTVAEDLALRNGVTEVGAKNWRAISLKFLKGKRSDVQCLHRWQKVRVCAGCGRMR